MIHPCPKKPRTIGMQNPESKLKSFVILIAIFFTSVIGTDGSKWKLIVGWELQLFITCACAWIHQQLWIYDWNKVIWFVVIAILKIQYPTQSFSAILTDSEVRKFYPLMNNITELNIQPKNEYWLLGIRAGSHKKLSGTIIHRFPLLYWLILAREFRFLCKILMLWKILLN